MPILQFRAECRAFAEQWKTASSPDEFQRLGVLGDWPHPYATMTKKAEAQILREMYKFLLNGLLYKGVKPVMWSVVEKTALAEAEIEYQDHTSTTLWVKFPVIKTAKRKELRKARRLVRAGKQRLSWTNSSGRSIRNCPQAGRCTTPYRHLDNDTLDHSGNRAIAYGDFSV